MYPATEKQGKEKCIKVIVQFQTCTKRLQSEVIENILETDETLAVYCDNSAFQCMFVSLCLSLQWQAISLTVIEKVQIAAIILGTLFLIASISWLVWSSVSPSAKWQRQDLLFQICYGMYGFMDIVCIGTMQIL